MELAIKAGLILPGDFIFGNLVHAVEPGEAMTTVYFGDLDHGRTVNTNMLVLVNRPLVGIFSKIGMAIAEE